MKKNIAVLIVFITGICLFFMLNKFNDLRINYFTELPKELDGGSCLFSINSQDFLKEKYIFINDYGEFGYAVINNHKQNFKLEKYDLDSGIFNYKNETYELEVDILSSKYTDKEIAYFDAKIILKNKDNQISKNVIGQCGS